VVEDTAAAPRVDFGHPRAARTGTDA